MTQANAITIHPSLLFKSKGFIQKAKDRGRVKNESNDVEDREHGKGGTNTKRTD